MRWEYFTWTSTSPESLDVDMSILGNIRWEAYAIKEEGSTLIVFFKRQLI